MRPSGRFCLRAFQQHGQRLAVAGLGVGDVIGNHHFVLHVDDQMQLVAEPFDHLRDLAVVIRVFLPPATGLRQAFFRFDGLGLFIPLPPGIERRGIAGNVDAQVRDGHAQFLNHAR